MGRKRSGHRGSAKKKGHGNKGVKRTEGEDESQHYRAMALADCLKEDILQITCLSCEPAAIAPSVATGGLAAHTESLCACAATLHPFCFLFHNWVQLRLTGACASSPSDKINV